MSSSDHKKQQRDLLKHIKEETPYYEQLTKDFPKVKGYPNSDIVIKFRKSARYRMKVHNRDNDKVQDGGDEDIGGGLNQLGVSLVKFNLGITRRC